MVYKNLPDLVFDVISNKIRKQWVMDRRRRGFSVTEGKGWYWKMWGMTKLKQRMDQTEKAQELDAWVFIKEFDQ